MMRFVTSAACVAALVLVGNPARAADDDKELKDLVAKAIKAHGGAENLAKIKATVTQAKGKYYGVGEDGIDYTGTWQFQAPDRMRIEVTGEVGGQMFKIVRVMEKDKGWQQLMDNLEDSSKEQLKEDREEIHAHWLASLVVLNDKECKLSAAGEMKIDDKPALGVRVESKGYGDATLYFDKETNRLVMLERRARDVMKGEDFTSQTYLKDYKKVNGALMSYKQTIKRDGKVFVESEVTGLEIKDKLDDEVFKKPAK